MNVSNTQFASIDSGIVKRFEQAWRGGEPVAIESLVSAEAPMYLPTLEELIHIDLEFRWKAATDGPPPPALESYLTRFPELNQPEVVRRLAQQE